jgi:hypothetical protein
MEDAVDFGAIIREAWTRTWRYRYLWVLGFFAGGTAAMAGGSGGRDSVRWEARGGDLERFAPELSQFGQELGRWAEANVGLIAAFVMLAVVFGLAMLIVSLIAQGGMAEATVDLARGRDTSFGRAWRTGARLFWRYAGLWLLLIGLGLVTAAVVIGAIVAVAILAGTGGPGIIAAVAVALLLALPMVLVAIAAAVAVSIVVAYAQRAIFTEDIGPAAALWVGLRLLREHPVNSVLVWLVNLALSVGAGIVATMAVLMVMFVLGMPGIGIWALAGLTAPTFGYLAGAGLVLLAAGLVVGGIANTFLWHYWTLAYLQLTGRRGSLVSA